MVLKKDFLKTLKKLYLQVVDDLNTPLWIISALETICMKCRILFSGKNKKNISICHLLKAQDKPGDVDGFVETVPDDTTATNP